ncbi:MAG: hypothetical protein ACYTHJ_19460 [Planctomycetota bacterium]|jgi:hypothetical protein
MRESRGTFWFILIGVTGLVAPATVQSEEMTLEYVGRYNHQPGVDHILSAVLVSPDRVLVGGTRLALIDPGTLPTNGTQQHVDFVSDWVRAHNMYVKDDYVFLNTHGVGDLPEQYGFRIVRIVDDTIQDVTSINEPGIFYEKMFIQGDFLFVAAHRHGLRIFNVSQPEEPILVGMLDEGFVDAFDIAVSGNVAYVADGAGGLKIVDVTDKAAPEILAGEDLTGAVGTAEAVTIRAGKVFVAIGANGVAIYDEGDVTSRQILDIGAFAEDLCWVGDYLAVSTYSGPFIVDPDASGGPAVVAREVNSRREETARLWLNCGIADGGGNRLLVASWDYMDVYEVKPASMSTQPDIIASTQRIRFHPEGGAETVTLTNNGQGDLQIGFITSILPSFTVDYVPGTLGPGQSMSVDITYDGTPTPGNSVIHIASNDPDENPFPIQVFGDTMYLDPGEPAVDFSLPMLTLDPETDAFVEETFALSQYAGKIVFFSIYGSW